MEKNKQYEKKHVNRMNDERLPIKYKAARRRIIGRSKEGMVRYFQENAYSIKHRRRRRDEE